MRVWASRHIRVENTQKHVNAIMCYVHELASIFLSEITLNLWILYNIPDLPGLREEAGEI